MIKIIEKISAVIVYIIFGSAILSYVSALIREPFEKITVIGLSAFALVAAVSGLCFAMSQVMEKEDDKSTVFYSGEKLLHSAILILETIVLKYASDTILSTTFMKSHEKFSTVISWVSFWLLFFISVNGAYFFLHGFEALHDLLWDRFQKRRQNIYKKSL